MTSSNLFPSSPLVRREYLSIKDREEQWDKYPYERWLHWGSWLAFETNDPELVIGLMGCSRIELVRWNESGISPKLNWEYALVALSGKFVFVPNGWCGRPQTIAPWLQPYLPLADISSTIGDIYLFDLWKNAGFACWSDGELKRAVFSNEHYDPIEEIGEPLFVEPEPRKLACDPHPVYSKNDIWKFANTVKANLWHLAPLELGEEVELWAIDEPYWRRSYNR